MDWSIVLNSVTLLIVAVTIVFNTLTIRSLIRTSDRLYEMHKARASYEQPGNAKIPLEVD